MASAASAETYQWQESVLSTRSLSFVSLHGEQPTRRSTLASIEDEPEGTDEMIRMPGQSGAVAAPFPVAALPLSISQCPLFRLPREIREAVYRYVLTNKYGICWPIDKLNRGLSPALLGTCKAIYAETAPVLYMQNELVFTHPTDANMFRRAIAAPEYACRMFKMMFRIKNGDARLWASYFNSMADERSLHKDYPYVKQLHVKFRGMRYQQVLSQEQNALHWLRDQRLDEVILSLRKFVEDVRIELCVRVPPDWDWAIWEAAIARVSMDRNNQVGVLFKDGDYVRLQDVWLRLDTEGSG